MTVMLGLWVQHERHGFDYDNESKVKAQLDYFTEVVKTYKDHPALLLWGVGNEVDLFYSNTKVWNAIEDIAAMIHQIDPNHPTSTVTAGLDPAEVRLIMANAPSIDIYGINTYGDIELCLIPSGLPAGKGHTSSVNGAQRTLGGQQDKMECSCRAEQQ